MKYRQLTNMFKFFLPNNTRELQIFIFFVIIYSSYTIFLAMNTFIIDDPEIHYDIYFGFDNTHIFHHGYLYIAGHPLFKYFTIPFIYIAKGLVYLFGLKAKTIFFTLLCTVITSLSIVYIFRYLREIIKLEKYPLYLITVFFGFFMTNLIQSFTTESFTLSLAFISFTIFIYSKYILDKEYVNFSTSFILSFILGGITISNFAMGLTPILFIKDTLKNKVTRIAILCLLFALLLICLDFIYGGIFQNIIFNLTTYTKPQNYYSYSRFHFLGTPILSSDIFWNEDAIKYIGIGTTHFVINQPLWKFIYIGIVAALCTWGALINYKNKLIYIIIISILPVFILHQVGRYGLVDGFIYGAHWVYAVPLMLGWLISSVNNNYKKTLIILITILSIILIINNIYMLTKFISLSLKYYPNYI